MIKRKDNPAKATLNKDYETMDDDKLDKVIHGLKVVGGYLDMKSYTDNIAFNLIPHIKDALELLQEQEETIKQKDKEIEEWIEAYNFEH